MIPSMPIPPISLSGRGGDASARSDATNSGGIGSAPWVVNFGSEPSFNPARVIFRADPYGLPGAMASTGQGPQASAAQGVAPGVLLLIALAALLALRKA